MRKNAIMCVMMVISLNVFAQEKNDPTMNERHAAKMKSELSLTDEQFNNIKALDEKFRMDQAKLRADTALTRESIMTARKKMQSEREKQIKQILSKEQYAKWMSMTHRQPQPSRQRESTSDLVAEMKNELGLNEDQVKKLKTINDMMTNQFRKLRSDTTTTAQNKGQAIRAAMEERNAKVKELLTEEQYEKFVAFERQKIREKRRGGRPLQH
jgi:hypothetical protein